MDLSHSSRVWLAKSPLISAVAAGFGFWVLLRLLERVLWVLVLVLLALILAAAMMPIIHAIRRFQIPPFGWRVPRAVAVLLIYLTLALLIGLMGYAIGDMLVSELVRLSVSLPLFAADLVQWLDDLERTNVIPPALVPSIEDIVAQVQLLAAQAADAVRLAGRFVEGIIGFGFRFFIVLTLALFMVVEAERILGFWVSLFPPDKRARARELTTRIGDRMSRWVLGQITVATIAGVMAGIAAAILGLPYPVLFGVVTAILDLAPVVGVALMMIPAFLFGLSQSLTIAIVAALVFYIISQIDANLLSPLITGRVVHLSPTLVIVAIPLGLALYGAVGAVVAIPVVVALQILTYELFLPWLRRQQGVEEEEPAQVVEQPVWMRVVRRIRK